MQQRLWSFKKTMITEYRTIQWNVVGKTGILRMVSPPANLMKAVFFDEISHFAEEILPASDVRGFIVTGRGRHFSSGADVDELLSLSSYQNGNISQLTRNSRAFSAIAACPKPSVAVINGVCLGSAMELALSCHFRFCGENALMGFPETGFNLIPGCGGTVLLNELSGIYTSMDLLFTGRNMNAREALSSGLADAVFPKSETENKALHFLHSLPASYHKIRRSQYLKSIPLHD